MRIKLFAQPTHPERIGSAKADPEPNGVKSKKRKQAVA